MASVPYINVPPNDTDINGHRLLIDENLNMRSPSPSRPDSPIPRLRRKRTASHAGQAGFMSSVINLSNTILGIYPFVVLCLKNDTDGCLGAGILGELSSSSSL